MQIEYWLNVEEPYVLLYTTNNLSFTTHLGLGTRSLFQGSHSS